MLELIQNAWMGWQQYIEKGRIAALLLAVLLFFWLGGQWKNHKEGKMLFIYGTVMTVLCICPLTAAVLMAYQTRFYDYQWVWSPVPVVLLIAWGGTVFLCHIWESYEKKKEKKWKAFAVTIGLACVLFLCGGLGERDGRSQAKQVLESLEGTQICLWAPQEIMEAARSYSGDITLPYGRNMWDASLNAYVYETYDESLQQMYWWMCKAEELAEKEQLSEELRPTDADKNAWRSIGIICVRNALDKGVNTILLPGALGEENVVWMQEQLQTEAVLVEGYYLFCRDENRQ